MRAPISIIALVSIAFGCARHAPASRNGEARDASTASDASTADASTAADASDAGKRAALDGYPELTELLGEDKEKLGFVSVPLGAEEPRPIMIAIHGGSEKPEVACAKWRTVTEAYPFVVCPRGFGGNPAALGWRTTADTSERIARAIAATSTKFGSWVKSTNTIVLAGFSMGGSQVALLARSAPEKYHRIAVGDSAHDPQPALTFSKAWAKGGGERAIFLCTTSGCEPSLRDAARNVASAKAHARLNIAPTQVHGLSELAAQSMRRDWPWLVEGADGWETFAPPAGISPPGRTETFEPN